MIPPRRVLAWLAALLALAALVVGAWAAAQFRSATHARPWFVRPSGLAAAGDRVYVGVDGAEIHVYAADGAPQRAWRLEVPGALRLRAVEDGLEVATRGGAGVAMYDARGQRVAERAEPGAWERLGAASERAARAGEARYVLDDRGLVRVAPAPARVLVPLPPPPLAWFGARPLLPVTGVLLCAPLGLALCLALGRRQPGGNA